jgi:quercetin dioxygenase-like cupin family protein
MKQTIINPLIKDEVNFIQTATGSAGKLTELLITLSPGGSNPLHYHRNFTETFTAIEGELGVRLSKTKKILLNSGENYAVPPGQLHAFFNPGNSVIKFNVRIEPGHEGFENSLRILYGLAADGLTNKQSIPKSLKHIAMIGYMSDMNIPGLIGAISPILNKWAQKLRASGEEEKLIKKYCI